MWSHERYYQNAWRPEAAWGHQQGGWGHELAWGRPYASGPWGRQYVGALDDTLLKDTLASKHEADTLYALANPQYGLAISTHAGYPAAIAAVEATIKSYRKARGIAQTVLALPSSVPQADEAKTWANKYIAEESEKITMLENVLSQLKTLNSGGVSNDQRADPVNLGSPMAMMVITVLAFAGGGALVGWLVLHSQKAALIGGGIGLAAGAVTQAASGAAAA